MLASTSTLPSRAVPQAAYIRLVAGKITRVKSLSRTDRRHVMGSVPVRVSIWKRSRGRSCGWTWKENMFTHSLSLSEFPEWSYSTVYCTQYTMRFFEHSVDQTVKYGQQRIFLYQLWFTNLIYMQGKADFGQLCFDSKARIRPNIIKIAEKKPTFEVDFRVCLGFF